MDKEINERFIQLTGKMETGQVLEHGDDVAVKVTVVQIIENDNQDGTFDIVYKAKMLEEN